MHALSARMSCLDLILLFFIDCLYVQDCELSEFQCSDPRVAEEKQVLWSRKFTQPMKVAEYVSVSYVDGNVWVK